MLTIILLIMPNLFYIYSYLFVIFLAFKAKVWRVKPHLN